MIAADLTLTSERSKVLDFSPPFMSFPVTILTKMVGSDVVIRKELLYYLPFYRNIQITYLQRKVEIQMLKALPLTIQIPSIRTHG